MQTKRIHRKGEHSRGRYVAGCRCDGCVQANRDYQREYLQRRVKAGIVDSHGKTFERASA